MELNEQFIKDNGLSEDQVKAVKAYGETYIATQKKEWDGKANADAEGIISGAAKYASEKTGVKLERQQGEKYGDYLQRLADEAVKAKSSEIEQKRQEYETKLKEFKGGDALKSELDAAKAKLDEALKKYADYDTLKEKAEKYEPAVQELSTLKLEVAFGNVKPTFPDTVNQYEAKAKWDEFKAEVLAKNTIQLVDGKPIAVDKENQYKQTKLEDLVKQNEAIQALLTGRQQSGTGAKQAAAKKVEGVPFEVPETAAKDSKERAKLIREHLAKEGVSEVSSKYAQMFAELNKKILAA